MKRHLLKELKGMVYYRKISKVQIFQLMGDTIEKAASISRSKLYKALDEGIFKKNTIFAIHNKNHLRNLKYLYENKNM